MEKFFFRLGAFFAALAVAAGSFGAHGLQEKVPPESILTWEKAVHYQMYHAFALFAIAWAITEWWDQAKILRIAGAFFTLGILLFSGSLYVIVATGNLIFQGFNLAYLTPIGGAAFILGWILLIFAARKA